MNFFGRCFHKMSFNDYWRWCLGSLINCFKNLFRFSFDVNFFNYIWFWCGSSLIDCIYNRFWCCFSKDIFRMRSYSAKILTTSYIRCTSLIYIWMINNEPYFFSNLINNYKPLLRMAIGLWLLRWFLNRISISV